MGTEAVKLVYFGNSSDNRQAFWRMPDGSFQPAGNEARLYLKDKRTGVTRLIQG